MRSRADHQDCGRERSHDAEKLVNAPLLVEARALALRHARQSLCGPFHASLR